MTQAVLRLRAPEMQPIVDHIAAQADKALQRLSEVQDTPTMFRAQGQYRALQDLLKHFADVERQASK